MFGSLNLFPFCFFRLFLLWCFWLLSLSLSGMISIFLNVLPTFSSTIFIKSIYSIKLFGSFNFVIINLFFSWFVVKLNSRVNLLDSFIDLSSSEWWQHVNFFEHFWCFNIVGKNRCALCSLFLLLFFHNLLRHFLLFS